MRREQRWIAAGIGVLAGLLWAGPGAQAIDNVEGPWGTHNGDNFGRARTTTPAGDWTAGIALAWELDVRALGLDRVAGRNPIAFDADGNIYWITSITGGTGGRQFLASVTPGMTLRWTSISLNEGGGGAFTQSGPVIGVERAYAAGGGNVFDYDGDGVPGQLVAAFNKATGATSWTLDLDGDWNNDGAAEVTLAPDPFGPPSPVLYNDRLYVVLIGGHGLGVAQISAATGALDWFDIVDPLVTYGTAGSVVHVPGVFTDTGEDGLFINLDDGPNDHALGTGLRDVFGIRVNPASGATLGWDAPGGNRARSHMIYNPVSGVLYAHTWWDQVIVDGAGATGFTVYDPQTGAILDTLRTGNFGFYDVGCLDFNDRSLIAGSFEAVVLAHDDLDDDGVIDQVRKYKSVDAWHGELRVYGQIARHGGRTLLIAGTNSRSDLGPDFQARVVVLDMSALLVPNVEDGPLYVDEVEVYAGVDRADALANPPVYAEDFESFASPGDVTQDPAWTDISGGTPNLGPPAIVADPLAVQGKVVEFDPAGNSFTNNVGATVTLPAPVGGSAAADPVVVIRWKQLRTDLSDNVDVIPDPQSSAFQWDLDGQIHFSAATDFAYAAPLTAGVWQDIEVEYDFTQDAVFGRVDGVDGVGLPPFTLDVTAPIVSLTFNMDPTPPVADEMIPLTAPVAEYNTGIVSDHAFTVRGGPYLGPDGKIYYFRAGDGFLVALKPVACDGDMNCDGLINFDDIDPFVVILAGGTPCQAANADVNGDGLVNFDDIDPFVALLASAANCPA